MKFLLAAFSLVIFSLTASSSYAQAEFPELLPHHALAVVWDVQGTQYATSHFDGSLRIYDTTGSVKTTIENAHSSSILAIAFNPSGDRIVSGGGDQAVRVWDTNSGIPIEEITDLGQTVETISWSPNNDFIWATTIDGVIHKILVTTGPEAYSLTQQITLADTTISAWNNTSTVLASGALNIDMRLINPVTQEVTRMLDATPVVDPIFPPFEHTTTISWHPTLDNIVANGKVNARIYIWDLNAFSNDTPLFILDANNNASDDAEIPFDYSVIAISFNSDGRILNSVSADGTVRAWDITTSTLLVDVNLNLSSNILSAAFSPDGTRLVYNTYPPALTLPTRLLGPESSANITPIVVDADNSGGENVNPDGSASSDSDGTINSYTWLRDGNIVATGVNPVFELPQGNHTLTLVVTDNTGLTDTSEVTVFIRENNPPTVTISYGFTFTETLLEGFPNPVMINVNNEFYTDDPDGDALTYEWRITYPSSRAGVIYSGTEDVISLNIGAPHSDYCNPMVLQLTATDPYGASASDTTTVSFVPLHTTGQCVPEF